MYVCLCNAYRASEIAEVAEEGVHSAHEAYLRLGNAPCCGRCLPTAQAIIDERRGAMAGAAEAIGSTRDATA